ncbi:MAG TPA: glycosyltransferase family 4 protein [Candidatus Nanoarchaeia archaeon]
MKKICIITTVHPPLDTRIFYREACSLAKKYEVVLIAPTEKDFEKGGVKIKALGLVGNRLQRLMKGTTALKFALRTDADTYHFHDPELIPVGFIIKLLTKKPVIYDIHENNPEYILDKEWIPSSSLKKAISFCVGIIENWAARILSGVIVVNDQLLKRFKKFNNNTELVRNFPNKDYGEGFSETHVNKREKIVLFVGGIEKERGVIKILEFVKRFPNYGLKFLFIGQVKGEKLKNEIATFIKKNNISELAFEIKPPVPHEEVPKYLNKAFIGIIPFLKTRNNYLGTPLKTFEYMAYGLPIVASDFLFLGRVIRDSQSGLLIKNPENIGEYKMAFDKILRSSNLWERYSANGRKAFIEKYNWEKEEKKLFDLYEKILEG